MKVSRIIEMNFIFYESKSYCEKQDNKPIEITYRDSVAIDSTVVYKMK